MHYFAGGVHSGKRKVYLSVCPALAAQILQLTSTRRGQRTFRPFSPRADKPKPSFLYILAV